MYLDPVFQTEDGRWTFYDEAYDEFPKTWETRDLAEQALKQYTQFLSTGEVTGSLLLVDEI
jgi:hypothetical protein